MKNILVTGGLGILGISLVKLLSKKNKKIVVLDKCKFSFLLKELPTSVKIIKGNIENIKLIKKIIKNNKIDFIFHLGAITQINDSFKKPYDAFKTNLFATVEILEFLRRNKKKIPLIYASSDKAYGEMVSPKYSEEHRLHGVFPYDVTKSTSDMICQSYSKTYGLKIGIIRSGNIYGPCDLNFQRLIPDLIVKAIKKKKFIFRSNGKTKRDYIYVDDVAIGYFKLLNKMKLSSKKLFIYNIGSKNNFNPLEVSKKIHSKLDIQENFTIKAKSKIEIKNQKLNYNKIKNDLNWIEKVSFNTGLNKTIKWYISNINNFKF
tara:strand:- start:773 stop:1726 length:954 start_codon:yes stop_codon:yes gene_type:complete